MKKNAKNISPSAATPTKSARCGQRLRSASATGSKQRKPPPKRNDAIVTGSISCATKRVATAASPPRALDSTAIATPARALMMNVSQCLEMKGTVEETCGHVPGPDAPSGKSTVILLTTGKQI